MRRRAYYFLIMFLIVSKRLQLDKETRAPLAAEKPNLDSVLASLELDPIVHPQELLGGQAAVLFV